jgi:hypothetical protein
MEVFFGSFLVGDVLAYRSPTPPHNTIYTRGTESTKMCGWFLTTRNNLLF